MAKKGAKSTVVLGLMSGTSLDGLDLALCEFSGTSGPPKYQILKAKTLAYDATWKKRLSQAPGLMAEAYFELHAAYGLFMAEAVLKFLKNCPKQPVLIGSHGHTIFHQPAKGFSTQLGCGATLAAKTGIATVCDFRSLDVALGGQGAPLVPIGDKLLFPKYRACVNLGGIANISFDDASGKRRAFDICETNLLLNHLSAKLGLPFDKSGAIARSGNWDTNLLDALNGLSFYKQKGARSLGREWFESTVLPLVQKGDISTKDQLATAVEHIAMKVAAVLDENRIPEALFSGGGALNSYLMERIQKHTKTKCVVADKEILNFKEALIFAFLAYLRVSDKINTLKSVTAASRDSMGGGIYLGVE